MATSKWQLDRLQIIHDSLSAWEGGIVTKSTLLDRCNASERTLKSDITYLREMYDAPIIYDRKQKGYRYTTSFSFAPSLGLHQKEITQLRLAMETLLQYQEVPVFSEMGGLLEKLEQVMQYKLRGDVDRLPIVFEREPVYKGKALIAPLLQAIEMQQVISFHYQSFRSPEPIFHLISPYVLKEHAHRWYVLGSKPKESTILTFALDRFVPDTLTPVEGDYEPQPEFDVQEHFAYTYGMTVYAEQAPQDVHLHLQPLQAKFFLSKPFHPFEILQEGEDGLVIRMLLRPNYELKRLLTGMGPGVKVLRPASLAEEVKLYLEAALQQYGT